ncbi:efflux RND transporter periplasmic adaptor subunit [Compostibacter hankyongensis]|uniref:Efflux RND transporter periplasmic adaptor subunit n=1 Tax=Compostibacter hankyongensis TaxID=1007089 RepID=A0ABP8FIK0_9BACT
MTRTPQPRFIRQSIHWILGALSVLLLYSCGSASSTGMTKPPEQSLPVLTLEKQPATLYREYSASLRGTRDIEIRPQVEGYLQGIAADEGTYVHKGEVLFRIDPRPYLEQLNNAKAGLLSAKAALERSDINVEKLTPLVKNQVVSDIQLKSAQADDAAARAQVARAEAAVSAAAIDVGYTTITAPADGYLGTIPFKTGSLVGPASSEPLTMLSETKEMHVYFSMSEKDFIQFKSQFPGATIEEKIKHLPPVQLVLADNSLYPEKGKVQLAEGQFDPSMGAINFRAVFPNPQGLLRSGNTGKIRIPQRFDEVVMVPQAATYEIQDKTFVFEVAEGNRVSGQPITISGSSGSYYLVTGGVKEGDKIVYTGLDRLKDGMQIIPQPLAMDSLIQTNPL